MDIIFKVDLRKLTKKQKQACSLCLQAVEKSIEKYNARILYFSISEKKWLRIYQLKDNDLIINQQGKLRQVKLKEFVC